MVIDITGLQTIVLPSSFMPNLGRMMLCQALSVLLLAIPTLKSVIGQSRRYSLTSFFLLILTVCGFRKEVFSLHLERDCVVQSFAGCLSCDYVQ